MVDVSAGPRALPLPGRAPKSDRDPIDILNDLADLRVKLAEHNKIVEDLLVQRDLLFIEAREGIRASIPQSRLADACGVKEVTVTAALRRLAERRAKLLRNLPPYP